MHSSSCSMRGYTDVVDADLSKYFDSIRTDNWCSQFLGAPRSVNYRLGALGWLHKRGMADVQAGMSDMIAALAWVRNHIAAFGGDPSRVTVMGQSAGATYPLRDPHTQRAVSSA